MQRKRREVALQTKRAPCDDLARSSWQEGTIHRAQACLGHHAEYSCIAVPGRRTYSRAVSSIEFSGPGQGFFSVRILWCTQNGDHPENNLAKFGYILFRKQAKPKKKKKTESFYIFGYLLEVIVENLPIFGIFYLQNLGHFNHNLVCVTLIFIFIFYLIFNFLVIIHFNKKHHFLESLSHSLIAQNICKVFFFFLKKNVTIMRNLRQILKFYKLYSSLWHC